MKPNVPTRTQLTNINQNRKNPVTQNALNGSNSKQVPSHRIESNEAK